MYDLQGYVQWAMGGIGRTIEISNWRQGLEIWVYDNTLEAGVFCINDGVVKVQPDDIDLTLRKGGEIGE